MFRTLAVLILMAFMSPFASAGTTVYFFEYRNQSGDVVSFDPWGRFYHAAMQTPDGIIEAHPYFGVHIVKNLSKIHYRLAGALYHIKDVPNLSQKIHNELGKSFELYSHWDNPKTTQCSKLIGQIIGVSPVPVEGNMISLSPDTLYRELKKMGFTDCQSCLNNP